MALDGKAAPLFPITWNVPGANCRGFQIPAETRPKPLQMGEKHIENFGRPAGQAARRGASAILRATDFSLTHGVCKIGPG
jgi:hypothetical protein